MRLYDYFRSSASYRVRIALQLKGLSAQRIPIHLVNNGGEQHSEAYKAVNPQQLVPCLETEDGNHLSQSLAIIEYLDEVYPQPPLLPESPVQRALARRIAYMIGCDIHPLNNLRILTYLRENFSADDKAIQKWYAHWIELGFHAIEALLEQESSDRVCVGEAISIADLCLIPQVYNAKRFNVDLSPYPRINAIDAFCLSQEAFYPPA